MRPVSRSFVLVFVGLAALAIPSGPAHAQPFWDDCATPIQIVNFPEFVPFDTTNTGPTPSLTGCPNMGGDLWFVIVAPFDGLFSLSHDFNPTQHAIYALPGGLGSGCPTDADQLYCDSPTNQNASLTPAIAGETYLVRVSGFQGGNVSGTLTFDMFPPPPGDDCTQPLPLNLPDVVAYDTTGASPTAGLTCAINRDIWYTVTPTLDGLISVNANPNNQSTAFGVDVAIYTEPVGGGCPTDAQLVDCNGSQSVSFAATAGETYLIQVGIPFGNEFASALLSIDQTFAPPTNDDCTTPESVTLPATVNFDTTGATPDATGLVCNANDDLWYAFVAPADGQVQVELAGIDLRHQVYHLPLGVGTCPTDFDALGGCWSIQESWTDIDAGESYAVRVGSGQSGPTTGFAEFSFVPSLANDECLQAIALAIPSTSPVTTFGATPDASGLGCTSEDDSWYSTTIPASGLLHLTFDDFLTLAIYDATAGCPAPGTEIFCDDLLETILSVTAGDELLLRISSFNPTPPVDTLLTMEILQTAANDDCAAPSAPEVITVPTAAPIAWDTLTASTGTNGIGCNVARDLWYSFVAPADGCLRFENDTDGQYALYEAPVGGGCPTTQPIACVTPTLGFPDRIDFAVTAGTEYLLQVGQFGNGLNPMTGAFTITEIICDPENVACDDSIPDQVTATFDIPAGTDYDLGVEVRVNGSFAATLPAGTTSYTELLATGFTGVVRIGFTGISSTLGSSQEVLCAAAFGAVTNDLCTGALAAGLGSNPVDTTIALLDPSAPSTICSGNDTADAWYTFTASVAQLYTFSVCTANFNARMDLFDGAGGCPTSTSTPLDCAFTGNCSTEWFLDVGDTVFIRVVALDLTGGTATLDIAADCPQLTGLTCTYDCTTDSVTLTWDGGFHDDYTITSGTGTLAVAWTTPSFTINSIAPGPQNFEVTGNCPNGSATAAQCSTFVIDPTPAEHMVLALERLPGFGGFGGSIGAVDSAGAIADLLIAAGKPVNLVTVPDFDTDPCVPALLTAAETIWVAAGTPPASYFLSAGERTLLADLAASGANIYLEGASLWGNAPPATPLDERDGVEANIFGNIDSGDDSFTAMDGVATTFANVDFSWISGTPYAQDSPTGNDSTDRLLISGTDTTGQIPADLDVAQAEAFIVNADDSGTGEPAYITGILAEALDGGRIIATSFEFGGFSGDASLLLEQYLAFFGDLPPPPGTLFRRGDVNADQTVNIADAVSLLSALFPPVGSPPAVINCADAADANNDGGLNIADAVRILEALFVPGSPPLPGPTPECGTVDDAPIDTGIGCDIPTCP